MLFYNSSRSRQRITDHPNSYRQQTDVLKTGKSIFSKILSIIPCSCTQGKKKSSEEKSHSSNALKNATKNPSVLNFKQVQITNYRITSR